MDSRSVTLSETGIPGVYLLTGAGEVHVQEGVNGVYVVKALEAPTAPPKPKRRYRRKAKAEEREPLKATDILRARQGRPRRVGVVTRETTVTANITAPTPTPTHTSA